MPDKAAKLSMAGPGAAVSQNLELICSQCGKGGSYDVGTILFEVPGGPEADLNYAFTKYFRCYQCGSAGPWNVVDELALLERIDRNIHGSESAGLVRGSYGLEDGTLVQTPAQAEDYFRKLIEKEPQKTDHYARLGNILRNSGEIVKAMDCFKKVLELDPAHISAHLNLLAYALRNGDQPDAIFHANALVRSFLDGWRAKTDKETQSNAFTLVKHLRSAPPSIKGHFLFGQASKSTDPETTFIRSLLQQTGDENLILDEASRRLLERKAESDLILRVIWVPKKIHQPLEHFHPSLRELILTEGLNAQEVVLPILIDEGGNILLEDKHKLLLIDETDKSGHWQVPSLRSLFRGNRLPPNNMDQFPPEYVPVFMLLETHLLNLCQVRIDRSDQEIEEIYSALRRRPDGKSLGKEHDYIWQALALVVGSREMSEAEYNAFMDALIGSVRRWAMRPISRHYVTYLRKSLGIPAR